MPTQLTPARPTGEWTHVFQHMQETIARTIAATPEPDALDHPPRADIPSALQQLDQQLARLQASLDEAERKAAETDAWLRSEAEALQRWLDSLQVNQRKLAEWAGRAV
jgi:chromosome segregation ATPase